MHVYMLKLYIDSMYFLVCTDVQWISFCIVCIYIYKDDDDICPLFSLAYYCKNSACEFGGAALWQIDEIRGLVRFFFFFFSLDISFDKKLNTHLPRHPCDIHIYHLYLFAHISFFLSYRRKMYLFIVLLSSTCTLYIFFFSFFFLFVYEEQSCYFLVVIILFIAITFCFLPIHHRTYFIVKKI